MTEVLLHRARQVAPDISPALTSLFIVGHGTDLNDNSAKAAKEQAGRIRALGDYAQVISSYMEEPPLISDWHKISQQPNAVIVPFFIADGLHSFQDIPVLIGIETEAASAGGQTGVFRRNPYLLHGKKLFYASAIGTEPMIADVILDQVLAAAGAD
jgi:sirohydrochlorin cobaltochelatase